jgi:hypothetical protein
VLRSPEQIELYFQTIRNQFDLAIQSFADDFVLSYETDNLLTSAYRAQWSSLIQDLRNRGYQGSISASVNWTDTPESLDREILQLFDVVGISSYFPLPSLGGREDVTDEELETAIAADVIPLVMNMIEYIGPHAFVGEIGYARTGNPDRPWEWNTSEPNPQFQERYISEVYKQLQRLGIPTSIYNGSFWDGHHQQNGNPENTDPFNISPTVLDEILSP